MEENPSTQSVNSVDGDPAGGNTDDSTAPTTDEVTPKIENATAEGADTNDADAAAESSVKTEINEIETEAVTGEGTSVAAETSDAADKINILKEGNAAAVEIKQEIKRSRKDAEGSSDDEDFAGFEDCNGERFSQRKKVKEEPLSDAESHAYEAIPFDIKSEVKSEESENTAGTATPEVKTPNYRKPFEFGWKREVVRRTHNVDRPPDNKKTEIYYIAPNGKKLKNINEIRPYLQDGLELTMFSFVREPLGGGLGPTEEIVRTARGPGGGPRRANFLDLGEPDPTLGFGKRIPKPKMPKGASPPPPATQRPKAATPVANKRSEADAETKTTAKTPKTSKAKGEPCTIQCVLAMGTIPQLQCKKCLCLFHHECVGLERFTGPIPNYICECCLYELAHPNAAPLRIQNTTANTATTQSNSETVVASQTLPQAAVPSTLPVPQQTAAISLASPNEKPTKSNKVPQQGTLTPGPQATVATPATTSTTSTSSNLHLSRTIRTEPKESTASTGGSVIGGMTTWVPPTASLASSRSQLDTNVTPPQSIAIVAGRKYIMVPKTNLMSVSPSGDTPSLIHSNEFAGLQSKTNSAAVPAATLTTGEDITPPFKKRLISRTAASKSQTPPIHSPSHPAVTATAAAIVIATSPKNSTVSSTTDKKSTVTIVSPSVHKLFAANFFNNVSLGYDVLLHTFQYLKVQELLRASCVCRMWNQAANHHSLWKTVRMKNSQVNDWSGFANTLKRNCTRHLDLRKMIMLPGNIDTNWQHFSENIGKVTQLESIDLCRCSSTVVEQIVESNPRLKVLNAVSIKDENLRIAGFHRLQQLTELRLKSLHTMNIDSLSSLRALKHLTHLSLTSIKDLGNKNIEVLGHLSKLETLELGECSEFTSDFSLDVLSNLSFLERLRLEKGQDNGLFNILDTVSQLPKFVHLELVNFDIKPGFDDYLKRCTNLKRLLIIPTYISQSATTNHLVLKGILDLADHLEQLTWVVTLELLRVTELYVDQYNSKRKDMKQEDKIPVLKPIPGVTEEELKSSKMQKTIFDAPQVEIVPLVSLENILASKMPKTKCSILKVPCLATWRQNMAAETQ